MNDNNKSKPTIMWVLNSGLRNGANNVVQTFAENVPEKLGFKSTFLCFDSEGLAVEDMRKITKTKGVHVTYADVENNPEKVKEEIKKIKPDFVHLNTESSSILSPILKDLNIPHILEFHGGPKVTEMLDVIEKYFGGKKQTFAEISKLYHSPDAVLSPAAVVFDKEHYAKVTSFAEKHIIYNGIKDLKPTIDSLPSKNEIREKWGYKPDDNIMLVPGNVEPRKGQDLALIEFNNLLKSEQIPKDTKMFIVGYRTENYDSILEKEFVDKVKDYIKDEALENNVKLITAQPNLWEFYKMSDSALLPTRNELIPLTVIEAREFGLPVIVSSLAGTPEEIDNFKDGILTQAPSPKGAFEKDRWFKSEYEKTKGAVPLRDAMVAVINDNGELKKNFYEVGHKRDGEQFSVEKMCSDYAKIVRNIIKRKTIEKIAMTSNSPRFSRSKSDIVESKSSLVLKKEIQKNSKMDKKLL